MQQGDLKQFADAILSPAAAANPNSYIPEVQKFYQPQARNQFVSSAGRGAETAAGEIGRQNEDRRQAAVQKRTDEINDMFDASKYQKKRKEDGGFAFFDPTGKEIPIDQYTKFTGQRRADVLSDSENPLDLKYLDDYNDTLKVITAINTGDTETLKEYAEAQPALRGMTPDELLKRLAKQYPHMYGLGSYDDTRRINGQDLEERDYYGRVPRNLDSPSASTEFQL